MDHVRFNDAGDGQAIAKLAGTSFHAGRDIAICRLRDNVRLGGVVFANFTHESIGIHSASWTPRWINRDMLYVTFDYPFNQLGVKRIFGQVPETNQHAVDFNEKLGFRTVARVEGVFPGNVACLVMRLDREDCRMLSVKPRTVITNKVAH